MGNYTSSSCFYTQDRSTATLMDTKGNLRRIKLPVKAAELMLEEPGYVVSPALVLLQTGRVFALKAEDELLAGKLYLFIRLSRVNRKITESELEIVESASAIEKMLRKNKKGATVLPAVSVVREEQIESDDVDALEEVDAGFVGCRRLGIWTPVLEPIFEEP